MAELEAEGEPRAPTRKLRNSAEREMAAIRTRYDEQIQRLSAVFDRLQDPEPKQLMERRRPVPFQGWKTATAITSKVAWAPKPSRSVCRTFDLEAASQLREEIDTGTGQRKARA